MKFFKKCMIFNMLRIIRKKHKVFNMRFTHFFSCFRRKSFSFPISYFRHISSPLFLIILMLIALNVHDKCFAAPVTSLSISPSAVDATTITASDENTRNSAITTAYNAHDHNDIDQTANTLAVGDAASGNKTIQANNADASKPFIRYDDTNNVWVSSRDGSTIEKFVVVTGATAAQFVIPQTMTNNQIIEYSVSSGRLEADSNNYMADDDQNTLIQIEESANENIIRMDTNGTERWIMTAAGERTMPTQPAFLVTNTGAQNNISNSGSVITLVADSEIFDQGGDFSANTFTAPVTGRYQINLSVALSNMDTAASDYYIVIVTSNRSYNHFVDPTQYVADVAGRHTFSISMLCDMDASDTVFAGFVQDAGTAQTDIAAANNLYFSGYLAL